MSSAQPPPPPYGVPSARPAPPTQRRRPSAWWFALGGGLIVAAVAAGIGLLVWTLGGFLATDATIAADGRAHSVSVPTDGDRFLWVREYDAASCSIIDTATGSEVAYAPLGGSYTRSGGSDAWVADRRFDPGSGRLEVTCAGAGGSVQIGAAPKIGNLVGGVFAAIAIPLALGGLGLVVLIVTAVLFATGAPRRGPHAG